MPLATSDENCFIDQSSCVYLIKDVLWDFRISAVEN